MGRMGLQLGIAKGLVSYEAGPFFVCVLCRVLQVRSSFAVADEPAKRSEHLVEMLFLGV